MLSVGFIASPREVNYITGTLDSYFDQFSERPTVFEEPGFGSYLNSRKVTRIVNGERKGCVRNWFDALNYLSRLDTDWIMLCEDDITFRPGARDTILNRLDTLGQDVVGVLSPYCSAMNATKKRGWIDPLMRVGFCGALCTIWNRISARFLLDRVDAFYHESRSQNTGEIQNLDYAIGRVMPAVIVHNPTLILHEGVISTIASNNKPENRDHQCRKPAL